MIPASEYGFRKSADARIIWTHSEDAARRMCRDYGYTLYVREVSRPRVATQRA